MSYRLILQPFVIVGIMHDLACWPDWYLVSFYSSTYFVLGCSSVLSWINSLHVHTFHSCRVSSCYFKERRFTFCNGKLGFLIRIRVLHAFILHKHYLEVELQAEILLSWLRLNVFFYQLHLSEYQWNRLFNKLWRLTPNLITSCSQKEKEELIVAGGACSPATLQRMHGEAKKWAWVKRLARVNFFIN